MAGLVAWPGTIWNRSRTTGWLPETSGDRLLVVRLWPSSAPPQSRITLPWTFRRAGFTVLCPIQIFATSRADLLAGLDRFAGAAWEPGTALHVPAEDTADRVCFAGRLAGPRTLLGAVAGYIAAQLLNTLIGLMAVPASAERLASPLKASIVVADFGLLAAGILLARDRFSFTIDADGLTLGIGRTPAFFRWVYRSHRSYTTNFVLQNFRQRQQK